MKQANCSLTPEGYPIIFFTALGTLAFAMLGCTVMTVIFLVLCWFSLNFFRDPERVVPAEANVAVSPADGKVVKIERMEDPISGETRVRLHERLQRPCEQNACDRYHYGHKVLRREVLQCLPRQGLQGQLALRLPD